MSSYIRIKKSEDPIIKSKDRVSSEIQKSRQGDSKQNVKTVMFLKNKLGLTWAFENTKKKKNLF